MTTDSKSIINCMPIIPSDWTEKNMFEKCMWIAKHIEKHLEYLRSKRAKFKHILETDSPIRAVIYEDWECGEPMSKTEVSCALGKDDILVLAQSQYELYDRSVKAHEDKLNEIESAISADNFKGLFDTLHIE